VVKCSEFAHCRKATSFVLKQKKQKFKSPLYASSAAQGLYPAKPVSTTGYLYFALSNCATYFFEMAKSKRPPPSRTSPIVLPRFRPKLGGDEGICTQICDCFATATVKRSVRH